MMMPGEPLWAANAPVGCSDDGYDYGGGDDDDGDDDGGGDDDDAWKGQRERRGR